MRLFSRPYFDLNMFIAFIFLAILPVASVSALSPSTADLLRKGGYVILMRHAQTSGTGDPSGFKLGDCATQRQLNAAGRAQATALGKTFTDARLSITRMLSSPWCRCVETAKLMLPGTAVETPSELGSYFMLMDQEQTTPTVKVWAEIEKWRGPGNMLIVSHQVNIDRITGRSIPQGAYVIIDPKTRSVVAEDRS